jgi:hypothetical protein
MKPFASIFALFVAASTVAVAGPEQFPERDLQQVATQPTPAAEWYGDHELNIDLWGAYAFTRTDSDRTGIQVTDNFLDYGTYDRFLGDDHAWGGGIDIKYFFHRYFGVGLEGFGLAAKSTHAVLDYGSQAAPRPSFRNDNHAVGAGLGTFTLRFPICSSRFAPYAWAGGGGIFGGRDDHAVGHDAVAPAFPDRFENSRETKSMGQFGGGLEIRITRHIGITGDFSWNVVEGPHNNFGMARTGLSFGF